MFYIYYYCIVCSSYYAFYDVVGHSIVHFPTNFEDILNALTTNITIKISSLTTGIRPKTYAFGRPHKMSETITHTYIQKNLSQ